MLMNYAYRVFTALLIVWLLGTAVIGFMRLPIAVAILQEMRLPTYVALLTGIYKLVAAAILLYPRTRVLREWAYASIFFMLITVYVANHIMHMEPALAAAPLIALALWAGSYSMRPVQLKLKAVE